eukprot:gnl/TRDRNA2_/TRDRNA2_169481_c0_seq1.p1 gnl/TRDRNA2_/TRDRNA2_169481_c0~~gnl/TRDRNA2_/TRDRNA2_169481_c0_seq1.p1  ORF type:complete len:1118 (-),score=243.61 gnl/TRDRNA2_/TRDRNA2_169481_c0_seq1:174-3065(-)
MAADMKDHGTTKEAAKPTTKDLTSALAAWHDLLTKGAADRPGCTLVCSGVPEVSAAIILARDLSAKYSSASMLRAIASLIEFSFSMRCSTPRELIAMEDLAYRLENDDAFADHYVMQHASQISKRDLRELEAAVKQGVTLSDTLYRIKFRSERVSMLQKLRREAAASREDISAQTAAASVSRAAVQAASKDVDVTTFGFVAQKADAKDVRCDAVDTGKLAEQLSALAPQELLATQEPLYKSGLEFAQMLLSSASQISQQELSCPKWHALKPFDVDDCKWFCSLCRKVEQLGHTMFGCRECDFDLCGECTEQVRSEQKSSESPAKHTSGILVEAAVSIAEALVAESLDCEVPRYRALATHRQELRAMHERYKAVITDAAARDAMADKMLQENVELSRLLGRLADEQVRAAARQELKENARLEAEKQLLQLEPQLRKANLELAACDAAIATWRSVAESCGGNLSKSKIADMLHADNDQPAAQVVDLSDPLPDEDVAAEGPQSAAPQGSHPLVSHASAADWARLEDGRRLNDTLMDLFMGILVDRLGGSRVYAFTSHFYSRLTSLDAEDGAQGWEHVRTWTRSARRTAPEGIFARDFLLMPVNVNSVHWLLAVICYPWAAATEPLSQFAALREAAPSAHPTVAFLDPLTGFVDDVEAKVLRVLRGYLACEWADCIGGCSFESERVEIRSPEGGVPQQSNGVDCGIYVLEFALQLLRHANHLETLAKGEPLHFSMPPQPRCRWRRAATALTAVSDGAATGAPEDTVIEAMRQLLDDTPAATFPAVEEELGRDDPAAEELRIVPATDEGLGGGPTVEKEPGTAQATDEDLGGGPTVEEELVTAQATDEGEMGGCNGNGLAGDTAVPAAEKPCSQEDFLDAAQSESAAARRRMFSKVDKGAANQSPNVRAVRPRNSESKWEHIPRAPPKRNRKPSIVSSKVISDFEGRLTLSPVSRPFGAFGRRKAAGK